MTEVRKHGSSLGRDGDATDAEINRKLTEHLRANAVRAGEDAALKQAPALSFKAEYRSSASPSVKCFGSAIYHAAVFGTIIALMTFAWLYSYFYEKDAN